MPSGLRRFVHGLRTEGGTPRRETAAIAAGVFIGCLPFYGFHLLMCIGAGWLLGLNRLKLYLAANISNPFVAPWLLFAELQVGSWVRRGSFHAVSVQSFQSAGVVVLTADLLLGSVVVGGVLAALAAWGTHVTIRARRGDERYVELVRRASDRYAATSITAWEFARGKLRHDPVYRAAIDDGLLEPVGGAGNETDGRTLVDVGCGQGLMLALLAEARREPPGEAERRLRPRFSRLVGVETRQRVAQLAAEALAGDAEVIAADARTTELPPAGCVLLFDVLHLLPASDQEALLRAAAAALQPGGVLVIREADAGAGWRFHAVRLGNRVKALAVGRWRQAFHFRTAAEWVDLLDRLGLAADVRPMGQGTPFGNVLLRAVPVSSPIAAAG